MKKTIIEITINHKRIIVFYCLGCRRYHPVVLENGWIFNNDISKPSINPAIVIKDVDGNIVCHSIIQNGNIKYYEKGIHDLIGMEIPMSEV